MSVNFTGQILLKKRVLHVILKHLFLLLKLPWRSKVKRKILEILHHKDIQLFYGKSIVFVWSQLDGGKVEQTWIFWSRHTCLHWGLNLGPLERSQNSIPLYHLSYQAFVCYLSKLCLFLISHSIYNCVLYLIMVYFKLFFQYNYDLIRNSRSLKWFKLISSKISCSSFPKNKNCLWQD